MIDADGWRYGETPGEGDARKLCTLQQQGMVWVGIRAYHHLQRRWMNNNEPEQAQVLAWQDLPEPTTKRWHFGKLL